ncbi:MAG: response regulator [SAR324 cluster bacterium]|nr:response regulator [SAR324 cluster bacterium]
MAKLLIIDDDPQVVQQVRALLSTQGYVSGFITKPEFLFPKLKVETFDLFLMDVNMPGTDGIMLLKQLKAHPDYSKVPVIMLTGETSDQLLAKCFELGAVDFITKPISELILKARVKTALTAKDAKDALEKRVEERTLELRDANEHLNDSYSKLEQLNQDFKRFVPEQFLQKILSWQSDSFQVGVGKEEPLSILFADIRSYTTHVEKMSPQENFDFLNQLFTHLEPAIRNNHGFIDKFIGDAIMALFDGKQSADHVVQAAIDIQTLLNSYNKGRRQQELPAIHLGIGIDTGPVMVGTLGTPSRVTSTVIGDHVNLSSRLEGLTKRFQVDILISHHTYAALTPDQYDIREVDVVKVRGRSEPVVIYEVFDSDPQELKQKKQDIQPSLSRGIQFYNERNFKGALDQFIQCLQILPEDGVSLSYIKRCQYFQKYPLPANNPYWDNVIKEIEGLMDYILSRRSNRYMFVTTSDVSPISVEQEDNLWQHLTGTVQDISATGLKLESSNELPIGQMVKLAIKVGDTPIQKYLQVNTLDTVCQIRWAREHKTSDQQKLWEYGLEIMKVEIEDEYVLQYALEKIGRQNPNIMV